MYQPFPGSNFPKANVTNICPNYKQIIFLISKNARAQILKSDYKQIIESLDLQT